MPGQRVTNLPPRHAVVDHAPPIHHRADRRLADKECVVRPTGAVSRLRTESLMRACRARASVQIRSMNLKRLLFRNKNPKFTYYLEKALIDYAPKALFERRLAHYLSLLETDSRSEHLNARLDYYHKQVAPFELSDFQTYRTFSRPPKSRVYYYDLKQYLKYFPIDGKFRLIPGDVREIPEEPALVKSRPIGDNNQHSIIMKFNAVRHFNFIEDHVPFHSKMDTLFARMDVTQRHRKAFYSQHFGNPKCDLGDVSGANPEWLTPKVSIAK